MSLLMPGFAAGQQVNLEDQQKIVTWSQAEERTLALSGLFYDDPIYKNYVDEIARKILVNIPGAEKFNYHFHTLRNPFLNAFATAAGGIFVHTGLVARMENEAQLAQVLAHEITHTLKQHPVLGYTHSKSQIAGYQLLSLGASVAFAMVGGRGIGAQLGDQFSQMGLVLITSASLSGYSRQDEEEADVEGLRWAVAAGYDPREVPKVFALLQQEYGDMGKVQNFFWGDHPRNTTRMAYLNDQIKKNYPEQSKKGGLIRSEEYRARVNLLLREDALLNIQYNQSHSALAELDTFLLRVPNDPTAVYYKGLAFQVITPPKADTVALAKEMFTKALKLDSSFALPHRALGQMAEKDSLKTGAILHYKMYLSLKPDAKDRLFMNWKIGKLQESLNPPSAVPKGGVK